MRVVVAGGGLAGLTAAARGLELGAEVLLLEKGESPGGSLPLSSGYAWTYRDMPTWREQAPAGDPELQGLVLRGLGPGIDWLERLGVPVLTRETGNPLTSGARLDPRGAVEALVRVVRGGGGRLLTGASLRGLLTDGEGAVAGARVRQDGREREWSGAVILATGGFAASRELVGRYVLGGEGYLPVRAHERSTGDGLLAALGAGARESAGMDEFYGRNLPAPPARFGPERFVEVSQLYGRYALAVNENGERYADEAADWSETLLTRATARQPGRRAFYVLDAGGMRGRIRERAARDMVAVAREVGGTVFEAGSLEDLAARLAGRGVPAARFLRTLAEYNAAARAGTAAGLSPSRSGDAPVVETPPFVAVEVAPAITHTTGGLRVDASCRVLGRADDRPIPNLYAAGVEAGGLATGGYASGLAAAVVLGKTAAESAANL